MNAKVIGLLVCLVIALVAGVTIVPMLVEWTTVQGDEVLVMQHWKSGVLDNVKLSGTHFFFPGAFYDLFKYDIGTQKITFDSQASNQDAEYQAIAVEVGENGGQKAWVAISVNYHLDTAKVVTLH